MNHESLNFTNPLKAFLSERAHKRVFEPAMLCVACVQGRNSFKF